MQRLHLGLRTAMVAAVLSAVALPDRCPGRWETIRYLLAAR